MWQYPTLLLLELTDPNTRRNWGKDVSDVSDLSPADHWCTPQRDHTAVCLSSAKNERPHFDHFLSRPTKVQTANEFSRSTSLIKPLFCFCTQSLKSNPCSVSPARHTFPFPFSLSPFVLNL